MDKRKDVVIRDVYKVFNLLIDLPFLCVYQMLGVTDKEFYLLVDYDADHDTHGLRDEMEIWQKVGGYPFPKVKDAWEINRIRSLIVPQVRGTPFSPPPRTAPKADEKLFSYLPGLLHLFESLYYAQGAVYDFRTLKDRLLQTSDGQFEILPVALYRLQHRQGDLPAGLSPNDKQLPPTLCTVVLGELLYALLTGTNQADFSLENARTYGLTRETIAFLDFLISGEAKTFDLVRERLRAFYEERAKTRISQATEARLASSPDQSRGALEEIGTSPSPVVFSPVVGAVSSVLKLTGFVFFLIGSYYFGRIQAVGKVLRRFFLELRALSLPDVGGYFSDLFGNAGKELRGLRTKAGDVFPVPEMELIQFTRYLAEMLAAGVPLARSLSVLRDQTADRRFSAAVAKIYTAVIEEGASLSRGMAKSPQIFPSLYVNMVSTGELSGNLDAVLRRLTEYLESSQRLKRKLKAAATYPLIIAVACIGFFSFFVYVILPKFMTIFEGLGIQLPWPTRVLVALVSFAHSPLTILLAVIIVIIVFFPLAAFLKSVLGKERVDLAKLRIPAFGKIYKKVLLARFCSTFGSLIDCGIPLLGSIEVTGQASGNEFFHMMLKGVLEEARIGTQLHVIFEGLPFFPKLFLSMLKVGEETAQMGPMLARMGEIYEMDVTDALQQFTTLIEPFLMAVMGFVVGFVVLAVFLPVYQIVTAIK